jgi:hypothetical protein
MNEESEVVTLESQSDIPRCAKSPKDDGRFDYDALYADRALRESIYKE